MKCGEGSPHLSKYFDLKLLVVILGFSVVLFDVSFTPQIKGFFFFLSEFQCY